MTFNATTLHNGLQVLTFDMPGLWSVAINLMVKVGSRHEQDDESGLSHFLEHMAFKGTKSRSARDIAEQFDAIGGHFNAYTGREYTVYHAKVLSSHLDAALDIIADIVQNSLFTKEDIAKELEVIRQEIAQNYDDPEDLVYDKLYEVAYKDQVFGSSILGSEATLSKFNEQSFRDFTRKHYSAQNMVLAVAGNVQHDAVEKLSARMFASLQNDSAPVCRAAKYSGGSHFISRDLEQTTVMLGFEGVSYHSLPELYHQQLLSLVLGGGISSRLFQRIREEQGLAYSVGAMNSAYNDTGMLNIYAATTPDKLRQLMDSIVEEIQNVMNGITAAELQRTKEQVKANIYMAEEKSSYKSEKIAKNFAVFGRYLPLEEVLDAIMSASATDIQYAASKVFSNVPSLSVIGSKPELVDYDAIRKRIIG